jgi:hypothetical protein
MPMNRYQAKASGEKGEVFANLPIVHQTSPDGLLAADGVSCTMCHQIQDEGLGDKTSFTAGFAVDEATPPGQRHAFGPYDVDAGRTNLMRSASTFLPRRAAHLQSSELCATCHTLFTHALNDAGEVVGELPEQVPYLEWKHSAYQASLSCQSCHMPMVEGAMPISAVMGIPREEVSRHVFRGGNFFVPKVLTRLRAELGVEALPQELDATSRKTAQHLETSAARLSLEEVEVAEGTLRAQVVIESLAGHKLPTAYPSRRAWIHFAVRDGAGELVFESGRLKSDGSIEGNDNDADAGRFEPHYREIDSEAQVQVYEAIMAAPDGTPTTVLLSAVSYAKDNRLLPDGFDKATADEEIAVHGAAALDGDFRAGGDRTRYAVDVASTAGPFQVEAELWYQPVAYRWAHNLRQQQAAEIERFVNAYEELAGGSAIVLARSSAATP